MIRFILFFILVVALDIYAFQAFRFLVKERWGTLLYFLITITVIGGLFWQLATGDRRNWSVTTQFFIVTFIIMMASKVILIGVMFGEDIFRVLEGFYYKLSGKTSSYTLPSRRKFISQVALGLAAIPFASILYGVIKGRYNFKVLKYTIYWRYGK